MKLPNEYTCNNHGYFMHIYRKSDTALITPFSSFPFVKVYLQWSLYPSLPLRLLFGSVFFWCSCILFTYTWWICVLRSKQKRAFYGWFWMCGCVYVCLRASTCIYMSDGEKVNIQTDRSFGFCTAIMFKNSNFLWSSLHNWIECWWLWGTMWRQAFLYINSYQQALLLACALSLFFSVCVSVSSSLIHSHDLSLALFFILCRFACIHKFCELSKQSRQNKGMIWARVCVYTLWNQSEKKKQWRRIEKKNCRTKWIAWHAIDEKSKVYMQLWAWATKVRTLKCSTKLRKSYFLVSKRTCKISFSFTLTGWISLSLVIESSNLHNLIERRKVKNKKKNSHTHTRAQTRIRFISLVNRFSNPIL